MEVQKFGFIRVISKDQNEGQQLEAINKLRVDKRDIFLDKQSGKNFNRVQYQLLKRVIHKEERDRSRKQKREGIDVALRNGAAFDRPKVQATEEYKEVYSRWKAEEMTAVK